jgi:hypothetical protein
MYRVSKRVSFDRAGDELKKAMPAAGVGEGKNLVPASSYKG